MSDSRRKGPTRRASVQDPSPDSSRQVGRPGGRRRRGDHPPGRGRKLARAGVAVLGLGALAVSVGILYTAPRSGPAVQAAGGAGGDPCPSTLPPIEPGGPRPWEVAIPISTYSTWNTRRGNVVTTIPVVGWSGLGPDMAMVLYHNSASVDAPFDISAGMGFSLGPGWTMAYSSQLILNDPQNPTIVTVVADDGTQDVFTWNGTAWVPPPGVHEQLEGVPDVQNGPNWELTHKDQSKHRYLGDTTAIRLMSIVDAVGNSTTIRYESNVGQTDVRVASITAAERDVVFEYAQNTDLLMRIVAPSAPGEPMMDRPWDFEYDAGNRLTKVTDPGGFEIKITYDVGGRIVTISDKRAQGTAGDVYTYDYDVSGHLTTVTDPDQANGTPGLVQRFSIQESCPSLDRTGIYTDRRGYAWRYDYAAFGDRDGNLRGITDPLGNRQTFVFDGDRNLVTYRDALANAWTFGYDDAGNLLGRADPLGHIQSWTYDTFNNVRFYTDAVGNTVEFKYGNGTVTCSHSFGGDPCATCTGGSNAGAACMSDIDCPGGTCLFDDGLCKVCTDNLDLTCATDADCNPGASCVGACNVFHDAMLLTRIIEPPDGQGNPIAETTLSYDTTSGQLIGGADPNGVVFGFDYDQWGQLASFTEGGVDPETGLQVGGGQVACSFVITSAGHVIASRCSPCGGLSYDALCNLTGSICCPGACSCSLENPCPTECTVLTCPCASELAPSEPPPGFPKLPCPGSAPDFPAISAEFTGARYSPKGELEQLPLTIHVGTATFSRSHMADYDELGRLTDRSIIGNESGTEITRRFTYDYSQWAPADPGQPGRIKRIGPDDVETVVELDAANRVISGRRGPETDPIMTADYAYLANGLVSTVSYGNGTSTVYTYDPAQRLIAIDHRRFNLTFLKLQYTYTDNDLVASITECTTSDCVPGSVSAAVTFDYDNRGRLIHEVRSDVADPTRNYNIAYKYDQGGNRTLKTEFLGPGLRHETTYTYDIEDAVTFGSANNRLMKSIKEEVSAGGFFMSSSTTTSTTTSSSSTTSSPTSNAFFGETRTLLETKWYYYNKQGNVTRVVTNQAGSDVFSSTRLVYARNGRAVAYVTGETWQYPFGDITRCPFGPDITYAREFRYDGPRQRYLNRELSVTLVGSSWDINTVSDVWSDYDGDTIYGDFEYDDETGTINNLRSFEPGIGTIPWFGNAPHTASIEYYHSDMIGTLRTTSNSSGRSGMLRVLTAFGEPVAGPSDRYGYAGAWGYQTDDTGQFPFLHVGARYYDPSTGRFLQRDPSGIVGGLNVYVYGPNRPTGGIDVDGEFWLSIVGGLVGAVTGGISGFLTTGTIGGTVAGAVGGAVTGALIGSGVPAPVAGAVGGSVGSFVGNIGSGKSPGRVFIEAGVSAGFGAGGGFLGSAVAGPAGGVVGGSAGVAGNVVVGGLETYFVKVPSQTYDNMRDSIDTYFRRRGFGAMNCSP